MNGYNGSMDRIQRSVSEYIRNNRRGGFPLGSPLNDEEVSEAIRTALDDLALHGYEEYNKSVVGLIRTLSGILRSKKAVGEKDLLDAIVEVLNLPYGRNALSGGAYDRLVDALLIPSETAGLVRKLRAREISCCGCGHQFAVGEIGTIIPAERREGVVIHCVTCSSPDTIRCKKCEGSLPLPKRLWNAIRSKALICEKCGSGTENQVADEPGEPPRNQPEPGRWATRTWAPDNGNHYVNNEENPFDPPTLPEGEIDEDQVVRRR